MRRAASLGGATREIFSASRRSEGRRAPVFTVLIASIALFLAAAPAASGAVVTQRPLLFTIDGNNVPDGPLQDATKVAVDNVTGAVYLGATASSGRVYRFHPDGTPWPFSSTGLPYLDGAASVEAPLITPTVAVDNSGGPNQSRIYVTDYGPSKLHAFAPTGELLWTREDSGGQPADVGVDSTGHPYTVRTSAGSASPVKRYDNTGTPPALLSSFLAFADAIDVNAAGDLFLRRNSKIEKWVSGAFSSVFDPDAGTFGGDVYVDQSSPTGSIFTSNSGSNEFQQLEIDATAGQFRLSFAGAETPDLPFTTSAAQMEVQLRAALEALPTIGVGNVSVSLFGDSKFALIGFRRLLGQADVEQLGCTNGTVPLSGGSGCLVTTTKAGESSDFQEYASGGALLETAPPNTVDLAQSVAYDPSLDRVYVLQEPEGSSPSVAAFGPSATGTVSNLTIGTPSAVGVSTAHFSGTVNPQGTSSEWRFQWRKAGQAWTIAPSSPPQSLPADSSDHVVEYTTNALRGNTTYQVRLVSVNSANQLAATSEIKTFSTSTAAQVPVVTVGTASAITTGGATIDGTVNPRGDTADWQVQTTTDPACASGYADQQVQALSPSSTSPVNVTYGVTGLLPAQHYCARIKATNSAGSVTSGFVEFETAEVVPTQVFTAYVAPRTDTTARLNGYVNPQGSEVTYRFEYSEDGSNWVTLPDMTSRRSREQIVVAEVVSGLQPNTTYHYRFTAENEAGTEEGEEREFTTRASVEVQAPARGIELVNPPDKGNQNLAGAPGASPTVTADGNRVVWQILGGAPGGNSATYVNFISDRSPSGWSSRSILPPAEEQQGGGELAFVLNTSTPDLRHFVMRALQPQALNFGPPTYMRLDDGQHQELLRALPHTAPDDITRYEGVDMTDDGAHVLWVNYETKQLEELNGVASDVLSIMPDGQPSECGLVWSDFSGPGETSGAQWNPGYHRMDSIDASRVYFQSVPNGQPCSSPKAIFYRDRDAAETIEVDPGSSPASSMVRTTPDGGSLIFLTAVSHVPEDANGGGDVYRWDAEGDEYTCLTCVVADPKLPGGAAGFGRILVSNDLSHIYFLSKRRLVAGYGKEGSTMLYVLSDDDLSFVAELGQDTSAAVDRAGLSSNGNVLVWYQETGKAQLTADETADQCSRPGESALGACQEIFRYEDSTESLECLSCDPSGTTQRSAGGGAGQSSTSVRQSADGRTAAFVTTEPLLEDDINNGPDVYEWRNGVVRLLSDGETSFTADGLFTPPRIYGIDAAGDNIFFTLVDDELTGYEQDGFANLYDARIGGGFPRPQAPQHCSEESCQGALQSPPAAAAAGSTSFSGAGNAPSQTRKGRCSGKHGAARRRCLNPRKQRHKRGKHGAGRKAHRAAGKNIGGSK